MADVHLVDSLEEANKFVHWLEFESEPIVAIDTETTGTDYRDTIRTFQIGDCEVGWVIPYERGYWGGLVHRCIDWLKTHDKRVIMHNFKFDQQMLDKDGLKLPDHMVYDTRIMAHNLDPTRPTGLKPLADRYVKGSASRGQEDLHDAMKKNKWTWATVPIDLPQYWFYGGLDTIITARLFRELSPLCFPRFQSIYDLEYASQVVLCRVEQRGVRIDTDYVRRATVALQDRASQLRRAAQLEYGITNLTSNAQVAEILMADGWEPTVFTETLKPKMDKHILNALADRYPLARMVVECKHLDKMASTQYLGGYEALMDDDGYLHPQINPIGARTGRMSVRTPALQTLHRDALVRDAFIPRDGRKLIFADYDQMEVRLTAAFSGDPQYIDIIKTSADVHRTTAAQVYSCTEEEVTKQMRQRVKNVIYAKLYGAGLDKFSETAGISLAEGERFMSQFDATFPAVKSLIEHITGARDSYGRRRTQGIATERYFNEGLAYVMSPYGRRHILNEREVEPYTVSLADGVERQWLNGPLYRLVNYLVQGTGADVLKQSIVDADRAGIADYLVLLVHDETGWDVPEKEIPEVRRIINEVMTVRDFQGTGVDLTVDDVVVNRWGDKYADTRDAELLTTLAETAHEMDDAPW